MNRWIVHVRQALRGIWFPATLFTVLGIALVMAAHLFGHLVPPELSRALGKDSTASILQILATSMLAVTTFSLTTMVSAYATATQIGTPRSIQLLAADRTSHHALSTFIGAFAFAIVGIVAQSAGVYGDGGQAFLLLGTVAVILAVLITLLRWISFLTRFGRMSDIIDRVENAAAKAMGDYAHNPLMGACPWASPPSTAHPVTGQDSGFVLNVDVAALQRIAEQQQCMIWVDRRGGSRIFAGQPLGFTSIALPDSACEAITHAFTIAAHRTFDQDPRLGLIALSEISSRALSPAVNDPGTAIEVLSATHRVLQPALRTDLDASRTAPRVYLQALDPQDLVQDAFRPVSRDGAATVEVAMRIQRELGALLAAADAQWAPALRAQAIESFHRARHALHAPEDIEQVQRLHTEALSQPGNLSGS
ncbi:DUF2254 domain-containing protein [Glutamicibacter sp. JL.03c]|uniref:DUF2254 domain-containing protein n=1 Tax=Glutamicibacter sp. JL.03c TaxID=2984842 RepID=UPI0021F73171|nr:DUF2254 domain-containing protein [Glutamicibacter sp. JL.03c]UYQ77422.1 DUF2254 domain-containing protein [Glutamicibacter sp. JL.03c]